MARKSLKKMFKKLLKIISKISDFIINTFEETITSCYNLIGKMKNLKNTNFNLGIYHLNNGNINDSIMRFKIVTMMDNNDCEALYQLARCYIIKNKYDLAKNILTKALALDKNHDKSIYRLNLLENIMPSHIPINIIEEDYNFNAASYQATYIDKLDYCVHKIFADEVKIFFPDENNPNIDILDLGCGTGLCGLEVKKNIPYANITGIDISELMLNFAKDIKINDLPIYKKLLKEDLSNFVNDTNCKFDVIMAGMSFQYLSELKNILLACKKILKEKGILIFTIHKLSDDKNYIYSEEYKYFLHRNTYVDNLIKEILYNNFYSKDLNLLLNRSGTIYVLAN